MECNEFYHKVFLKHDSLLVHKLLQDVVVNEILLLRHQLKKENRFYMSTAFYSERCDLLTCDELNRVSINHRPILPPTTEVQPAVLCCDASNHKSVSHHFIFGCKVRRAVVRE